MADFIEELLEAKKFLISQGIDLNKNIKPFKVIELLKDYKNYHQKKK